MELLLTIGMIIGAYILCHLDEWRSDNRMTPPGYEHDYNKANYDLVTKGKQYYYQQHLQGKYDKKIDDKNKHWYILH